MQNLTNDEMNLICIYGSDETRNGVMAAIIEMKKYLEADEKELLKLADSVLGKLGKMDDREFDKLELIPDFDE